MKTRSTPANGVVPASPPVPPERIELSESERQFLAACEAAYEANPSELYTLEEVVAHIKRKK